MAAVTNNDITDSLETWEDSGVEVDVGSIHGLAGPAATARSVGASHSNLTKSVWARALLEQDLSQRKYELRRNAKGKYFFIVTPALPADLIPWAPAKNDDQCRFKLWSEDNQKMACPAFSLPAGGLLTGGSCPGADAAQTVTPVAQRSARLESHPDGHYLRAKAPGGQAVPMREGLTICSRCVAGDTLILVRERGLVPIADLADGSEIEVWSGQAWRKTRAVLTGVRETVVVKTSWGLSVRVTPDHQMLTPDGWVEACDLEDDDVLISQPSETSPFPALAELPRVHLGPAYRTEKRGELPRVWSREVGVFLGYAIGNGWMTNHEYPTLGVCAGGEDAGDLRRLAVTVSHWSGSEAEVLIHDEVPSGLATHANQPIARLLWRQKSVIALVRSLGFAKRGAQMRTPDAIWAASEVGVAGYVSGLFSTDGSVSAAPKKVEVSFSSISRVLVEEVQQILFALGIRSNICEYKSNRERGYQQLWKLSIGSRKSVQTFADRIGFFNARKAARLADALAKLVPGEARVRHPHVVEVTPTGKEEPVYDLVNVGEEHQFSANGLTVHNCYAESQSGSFTRTNNQFRVVLCYWWLRQSLAAGRMDWLVDIFMDSIKHLSFGSERHRIQPIRLHDSGDFFSADYAEMWCRIADRLAVEMPAVVLWAPTRTWAQGGWNEFWAKRLGTLASLRTSGRPNLIVRASGYNFGDMSPGQLHPTNAKGTTSLFKPSAQVQEFLRNRTDPMKVARPGAAEPRADWNCQVYGADETSCTHAMAPDGRKGCRACWLHPELSVNYSAH